jgi:hypothetical protein
MKEEQLLKKQTHIFGGKSMDQKTSRRQFFTRAGQVFGIALVAPSILSSTVFAAEERRRARPTEGAAAGGAGAGADKPMVDPKSDQAKAVHFVTKKADVKDAALKTERNGVPFDKQFCNGCQFYVPAGKKGGGEVGSCQILSGNLVPSQGWCTTWAKKA